MSAVDSCTFGLEPALSYVVSLMCLKMAVVDCCELLVKYSEFSDLFFTRSITVGGFSPCRLPLVSALLQV